MKPRLAPCCGACTRAGCGSRAPGLTCIAAHPPYPWQAQMDKVTRWAAVPLLEHARLEVEWALVGARNAQSPDGYAEVLERVARARVLLKTVAEAGGER